MEHVNFLQLLIVFVALCCFALGGVIVAEWFQRVATLESRKRLAQLVEDHPDVDIAPKRTVLPEIEKVLPYFLRRRLMQAGIRFDPTRLSIVTFALAGIWILSVVISGVLTAIIVDGFLVLCAFAITDFLAAKRVNLLSVAMTGYLERIRQLLIVGNSLSVALQRATNGSPPIVIEFLSPTIRRIGNGAGLAESVIQLAEEIDVHELRLFGAAIETNLRFGGSLSAVISNLIENIRRRAAIERELRANTSQIRASAWILGLLPLFVCAVVLFKNPSYMAYFVVTPTGNKMLVYSILSEAVGILLMRTIVRVNY